MSRRTSSWTTRSSGSGEDAARDDAAAGGTIAVKKETREKECRPVANKEAAARHSASAASTDVMGFMSAAKAVTAPQMLVATSLANNAARTQEFALLAEVARSSIAAQAAAASSAGANDHGRARRHRRPRETTASETSSHLRTGTFAESPQALVSGTAARCGQSALEPLDSRSFLFNETYSDK